jgi:cyclohexanone monooxygenase
MKSIVRRNERFDAIVIGAGISGMYQLHRLRGLGLRARVFEAGDVSGRYWSGAAM